ncbi:MAG TPA: beta-ketoacyl synthase N-terminal-like domain-containing protein [Burkholderiaceae bacterium]|nr:beta-ketoacyl synthase N-terminal-like domain-containing protein [Burkholderiaceae bacterium]
MSERVFIAGLGASTAVGRGAWESAAAVRAGISGFTQHPFMIDTAGEPMRAAIAPWLDIGLAGADRFEALLFPAIEEAMSVLQTLPSSPSRWAIALALPSPRPGLAENIAADLTARLTRRYKSVFGSLAVFSAGHAAGLLGVQAACTKLSLGALDACVVAGVESWLEPETLEWLEENDQLHGAGPLNNAWGFVPGEAGAALLLVNEDSAHAMNLQPLAGVLGVGSAHEPKRIKTETVCIGEGLTAAFRGALAKLPPGRKVTDIYCDMNGEPYRADEFGFTALRTKEHFESASDFVAPADCWGDVSAAGGLLHAMLACAAGQKRYAKGSLALAWASAEMGERAAALLACAAPGSERAARN